MSEFRLFCIGALVSAFALSLVGKRLGDAAIKGSAASSMVTLTLFVLGGLVAVALFGRAKA